MKSTSATSGRRRRLAALAGILTLAPVLVMSLSSANLADSTFDTGDGNLKLDVDDGADWASVTENRKADKPAGTTDDSFGQGTKEDTAVPSVVSGSIPPNKSDLTTFGVYFEQNNAGKFLHMFWHRVQDPSGTTNMDFEFNQSKISANGVTPVRTAGDLLIQYDLSQGGVNPQLFLSRWVDSGLGSQCEASNAVPCWSTRSNLSAASIARGSINTAAIPSGEADGLGAISPRTFGEATVDFGALSSGTCLGFGSAYLKSRSSDSFTAAAKDFIAPVKTDINTCGKITIRKETVPDGAAGSFTFTDNIETVPDLAGGFSLSDGGAQEFANTKFGTYRVTESSLPADWSLTGIDCSASTAGVSTTVDLANKWVDITIDDPADLADCTFTNRKTFSPTIATSLNGSSPSISVVVGSSVYDTATLSGATSDASGTVAYTAYSDSACSQNAQPAGTKTVTNGSVPQSNTLTFNTAGTYYWQAFYSGDTFNHSATSVCTAEVLTVTRKQPTATTAQNVKPNDSFALSGGFNATGNVTFSLYPPSNASCSGDGVLTETVALSGSSAATNNTTFVASAEGTWKWKVVYTGDINNEGVTLACGHEAFTIDNNTTN